MHASQKSFATITWDHDLGATPPHNHGLLRGILQNRDTSAEGGAVYRRPLVKKNKKQANYMDLQLELRWLELAVCAKVTATHFEQTTCCSAGREWCVTAC